jgi:hypothetical protein
VSWAECLDLERDFLLSSVRGGVGSDAVDADRFNGRGRTGGNATGDESSMARLDMGVNG